MNLQKKSGQGKVSMQKHSTQEVIDQFEEYIYKKEGLR